MCFVAHSDLIAQMRYATTTNLVYGTISSPTYVRILFCDDFSKH